MKSCCHPECGAVATDEWKGWDWCRDHFFLILQLDQPAQEPAA